MRRQRQQRREPQKGSLEDSRRLEQRPQVLCLLSLLHLSRKLRVERRVASPVAIQARAAEAARTRSSVRMSSIASTFPSSRGLEAV